MTYRILERFPDGSQEWLEQRRQGIGASDSAAVLGLAPGSWGKTPLSVFRSKMGAEDEIPENLAFFGHALEASLARWVIEKHPEVGTVGDGLDLQWVECPWLTAKPDRVVEDDDGNIIPLELKTSSAFARDQWADGVPVWYQVQVQQQIAIMDATYGYLAVLHGGNDPELFRLERDQEFIDEVLVPKTKAFWEEHVVPKVAPEPTTFSDLEEYVGDPEITVEGGEDLYDLWDEYGRIQSIIVENRDLLDDVKLKLQVAMKDATALTYQGRELFTWRRNKPTKAFDKAGLTKAHPELVAEYTHMKPGNRVFRRIVKKEVEK